MLEPDLSDASFSGAVEIGFEVVESVSELVANSIELVINAATVDGVGVTWALDEPTERITFTVGSPLPIGTHHTLRIEFKGILNDKLRGFYRSTFVDDAGVTQTIATTQMQSTDCRRAFPCWDEPDFKATFGVTLVVDRLLMAISNSPEAGRVRQANNKVAISFEPTMKMSTYLVAFIVGPLEATQAVDVDGVPMRVVHVPGKAHLTAFALEIGAFALRWLQRYYGIDYPGQKIDLVALPDFGAGAMENLGCVTFRENMLLIDPAASTPSDEQLVADVVAHELAHMWFGDLVTMRWWNGIWLNEAFATFMEVAVCDAFRPDWERWTAFSLARSAAFEVDALAATRAVEFEVQSPQEAEGMFDVLTYEKGGALLRMLEQYLGPTRFRDGIRLYLGRHTYDNTDTADLWDALEEATGEPVRRLMDSWIWQHGYPAVSISTQDNTSVASQMRFRFDGADDPTIWVVPLQLRQLAPPHATTQLLLDTAATPLPFTGRGPILANVGSHGFFRTLYRPDDLEQITGRHLDQLNTAERYALADDAWSMVVAGHLRADEYCKAIQGFGADRNLPVWQTITSALQWLDRFVEGNSRDHFKAFVRGLVGPVLDTVGWTPLSQESDLTGELRGVLIRAHAILGDDVHSQGRARDCHELHLADSRAVDPVVAGAALSVVAATGTAADYEACLRRYRQTDNPQAKLRELAALSQFPGINHTVQTLELALTDEIRTQNAPFVMSRSIAHRAHGDASWAFVRDHWDEAVARFPGNTIVRMVDSVKTLTTPDQQASVQTFFSEHPIPQGARTLKQILERQRINVELRKRAASELSATFG